MSDVREAFETTSGAATQSMLNDVSSVNDKSAILC